MIEPFSPSKCILAALHGFRPEKMLVLYALRCFSTTDFECEADRIRGEFFLELFVQKIVGYQEAVTFCTKNWFLFWDNLIAFREILFLCFSWEELVTGKLGRH